MSEPTFVARERELAQLHTWLQQALAGQTQVGFITGEAGTGKSALVREFARQAQERTPTLVVALGTCNAATGLGDPYLPFREVLALLTGDVDAKLAPQTLSAKNAQRLKGLLRLSGAALLEFGPDLIETFVPGGALLTRVAAFAADQTGLSEQVQQRLDRHADRPVELDQAKIFQQYTGVVQALARHLPLVLVLDDLHWADSASISLLFQLTRQLTTSPVLLLGTYRPADVALGRGGARHPLEPVLNEIKRYSGASEVDLGATSRAEGGSFVDALLDREPNRLDGRFRAALYAHTGGHALFTTELLRNLQERGDLRRDEAGRWVAGPRLDWDTLPARVEGVIAERIGRLAEDLRETLRIASVEGADFTAEVVARVQEVAERQLMKNLSRELEKRHRLVTEEGEAQVGQEVLARYRFAHALFQQYLYNDLSKQERRLLHGAVAAALEALYAGHTEAITVQLARHQELAGAAAKAIPLLAEAGQRAYGLGAYAEAESLHQRMLALARSSGDPTNAAQALWYLTRIAMDTGDWPALRAYGEEMLAAARAAGDAALITRALNMLGVAAAGTGAEAEAQRWYEEALIAARVLGDRLRISVVLNNLADVLRRRRAFAAAEELLLEALENAPQARVAPLMNLGEVAYELGQPDRGRAFFAEAITAAQQSGRRLDLAEALIMQGFYTGDRANVQAGLRLGWEMGALSTVLMGLIGGAGLLLRAGQAERAALVLGAVLAHPAHPRYDRIYSAMVLEEVRAQGPAAAVEAALQRGQGQELAPLVALILSVPTPETETGPK